VLRSLVFLVLLWHIFLYFQLHFETNDAPRTAIR